MARNERRHGGTFVVGLVLMLLGTGVAFAGPATMPQQTGVVDLRSQIDVRIDGGVSYDQLGTAVAPAGDVNGDGLADVLVGAREATNNGRQLSGSVYVVFGGESRSLIDAASLRERGYRVDGAAAFDHAGDAVAGIGDVNGDGRADILIGAPGAGNNSRRSSGSAYVVFGKSTTTNVDLDSLGAGGFRIDGASAFDNAGDAVAAAGDVNGDGKADFLVGAPSADLNGHAASGSVYVLFGRATTASIDLQSVGDDGFRIDGAGALDYAGDTIASGGDVNGDGRPDILIGVDWPAGRVPYGAGSVYVVFGKASTSAVRLDSLGDAGFRIDGAEQDDHAGTAVAGAGDVNGDGLADILVGAPGADDNARSSSGATYIVFGKASNTVLNLRGLSTGGFRIDGANVGDELGRSLAAAGDVNGDGFSDLVVGAPYASNAGRIQSGSAYVVYGTAAPTSLDLRTADPVLRVDGAQVYYAAGASVASGGDFNGDGRPDIIVGSPSASYNGSRAGSAYVIFGFGKPELAFDPVTATVGTAVNVAPKTFRHTGVASFSVAPPLPPGLDLASRSGALTGTPAAGARPATYTVTMTDATGTVTAPLDLTVTDFIPPTVGVNAQSESIRKQRGAVSIRVTVDELCTIAVSGAVRVAGSTVSIGMAGARAKLAAEESRTFKLRLSPSALRRLQGVLASRRRATASVVVRATDDFGNSTTRRLSVRLTR